MTITCIIIIISIRIGSINIHIINIIIIISWPERRRRPLCVSAIMVVAIAF